MIAFMFWKISPCENFDKQVCPVCLEFIPLNYRGWMPELSDSANYESREYGKLCFEINSCICPTCSEFVYSSIIGITSSEASAIINTNSIPLGQGKEKSSYWIEWEELRWEGYPALLDFKWHAEWHEKFETIPFYFHDELVNPGGEKHNWVVIHSLPLFSSTKSTDFSKFIMIVSRMAMTFYKIQFRH